MTHYDVKRLALVLSVQAEIEAIKAENTLRAMKAESPVYSKAEFMVCAHQLQTYAYAPDEQL